MIEVTIAISENSNHTLATCTSCGDQFPVGQKSPMKSKHARVLGVTARRQSVDDGGGRARQIGGSEDQEKTTKKEQGTVK